MGGKGLDEREWTEREIDKNEWAEREIDDREWADREIDDREWAQRERAQTAERAQEGMDREGNS